MKSVFLLTLMSLSTFAFSATEWKVVAETTNSCKDKIQVLAKEGEKFVYVAEGDMRTKLFAEENGAIYSETSGKDVVFSNESDKTLSPDAKRFTFTQPSMVEANLPKINVAMNGVRDNCKMNLK